MQPQQDMPLKKTHLPQNNPVEEKQSMEKALEGIKSIDMLKEDQVKEVKRLLVEKGLTIDMILDRYKDIAETNPKSVLASDVLKVLERLERLHGLQDKSDDQLQIRALIQNKSASEITTTLIEITGKTQEYIKKLTERG